MLVFPFPVYALAGRSESALFFRKAPTGGLAGMSPLPDPNPACGFEWRAFTAGFGGAQGGMAHKMQGDTDYSKRSFKVVRIWSSADLANAFRLV